MNVLKPSQIAANAGTSGVVYAVTDDLMYDPQTRINSFAHFNHSKEVNRIGILLCINGTGITNNRIRSLNGKANYEDLNSTIQNVPPGSDGLGMVQNVC